MLTPEERIAKLEQIVDALLKTDRYVFDKNIQILDGRKIQCGKTNGLKIGTETTQKIGFFNTTPASQQLKANHNNWATVGDVVSALVNLGLLDTN